MNKHWRIAICGFGSIGKRHLRNLRDILIDRDESMQVDFVRNDKDDIPEEFSDIGNAVFHYTDTVPDNYDIVFVTNPTKMHFETVKNMQWHTKAMFIEKPLYETISHANFQTNPNCIYYIACPVRYKQVIQYIKNNIKTTDVLSATAVCSSYLPDWRPGTDYRKCYSAIDSMGGGVSLDLIHELDYLSYLFGEVTEIYNIRGHVSPLEIDSDDVSVYIAKMDNVITSVYLDYIGRSDIRKLTVFMKEDTIEADLLSNKIGFLKSGKELYFDETRDDFQKAELRYFLGVVDGKNENSNDLEIAYRTLRNSFGRI